jgi:hypothetical protein
VLRAESAAAQRTSVRQFVDRVGVQYGVQSVLDGPVDGAGDERGGHSWGLAARGIPVTVAIMRAHDEAKVRRVYVAAGLKPPELCCVADPLAPRALPEVDLVISFDAPRCIPEWRQYLAVLARAARKVLVVIVRNPERILGRAVHPSHDTRELTRVLWGVGRVREHAYLGVPSWVFALQHSRGAGATQDVVQSPAGVAVRLVAPLHAFVVDTSPRTPQARRRLGLAATIPS